MPSSAVPHALSDAVRECAVVRLHLWLETGEGVAFGLGRLQLLEAVSSTGSLRAAAEQMGMSYRAAWGKLKTTEAAVQRKLVEKRAGNRCGYQLTSFGQELVANYKQWLLRVESHALAQAEELFPFHLEAYDGPGA